MPGATGKGLNHCGLLCRDNRFHFKTTQGKRDSGFVSQELASLAFGTRQSLWYRIMLAATPQTTCKLVSLGATWTFHLLPTPYSRHLNRSEFLWCKLTYLWLSPEHYPSEDSLFYILTQILAAFGDSLRIDFADRRFV